MVAVGPKTWNANVLAVDGDVVTLDIRAKWLNYHDGGGIWLPIESTWQAASNGRYEHTASNWSLVAPAYADGDIYSYQEGDYDIFSGSAFTMTRTPELRLAHAEASHVEAYYDPAKPYEVRYPNAFGAGCSLLLRTWHARAMRPEHLIEITSLPETTADVEIVERVYTSMAIPGWDGSDRDIGSTGAGMLVQSESYGMGMRPAVAWYRDGQGELVTTSISVIAKRLTGYVELRKIIPYAFISAGFAAGATAIYADETLTVYPDPDVETTTFDARYNAGGYNASFSVPSGAASSSTAADSITSGEISGYVSTATSNRFSTVMRGGFGFDTSSLGAGATISAATFSLYGTSKQNSFASGGASLNLCLFSPGSNTAAANADYGTIDKTLQSDDSVIYSGWSTTGYNTLNLNSTGLGNINKTGRTWLMTCSANDQAVSAPPWGVNKQTDLQAYYAEQTGTSQDPKLVVTYTAGGGGGATGGRLMPRGVGRGIMRGCA